VVLSATGNILFNTWSKIKHHLCTGTQRNILEDVWIFDINYSI
jgi:hypothetical protein